MAKRSTRKGVRKGSKVKVAGVCATVLAVKKVGKKKLVTIKRGAKRYSFAASKVRRVKKCP